MGREIMISKCFALAAIVAIGLQVGGCYTEYGPVSAAPDPTIGSKMATRLQAGDKLKVIVYGEDTLSGLYDIDASGNLTMPLIRIVRAAGRTRSELERDIAGKYSSGNYLQEPKVTVDVFESRPIYILGEALKPGAYPYKSGLNVLTAVAMAGGFTYRASRSLVLVEHAGDTIWHEYPISASVLIAPGDLIRIPERYF
jgi:protein involved in polysaccharide export with SLBB domain